MISLLWPRGQDSALSAEDTDPCEYPGLYCAVQSLYSTVHTVQPLTDAHST